ncbi:putative quinol monooxygenase, partial [Burkholderia gladioli]|uniref:putative quinol monooxygenase n=1 Tax=Burkholderia gladioli TaxID=28095 RepID=UPI00163E0AB4
MRHSCFATLRNRTGKLVVLASSALIAASAFAAAPDASSNALPYSNLSTLHIKAAQLQPFLRALRHNADNAREEAGNLSFTVFQSTTSP